MQNMQKKEEKMPKCYINGSQYTFNKNTTILEILKREKKDYKRVLLVRRNNKLCDLYEKIRERDRIETLGLESREGFRCYQNSLSFLLSSVIGKVLPGKKLVVEHSFVDGFYCKFTDGYITHKIDMEAITREMSGMIKQKLPFEKVQKTKRKLDKHFIEKEIFEKIELFEYQKPKNINLYSCGDYIDFTFTPLVPDASYLFSFDLQYYKPGFILRFPQPSKNGKMLSFSDEKKLFKIFEEYERWGEILGVSSIVSLNRVIVDNEISDLIKISEALHEKKIAKIADEIKEKVREVKIVLIAGPSASGKTTFSKRLSIQLKVNCLSPITISTDDYFKERNRTPKFPDGSVDFESLRAIDVKLLNKHLISLLQGKQVEIPKFEFTTGKRLRGRRIKMGKTEILIVEGIHGLNEELTQHIQKTNKFKVYISALTQLNVDNEHRISTRDTRIVRRIVRDNLYRKHSACETIRLWQNVEKGENKNIFPFQEEADVMFNSALIYELSVLKRFAIPLLKNVGSEHKEYTTSERLLKFLSFFKGISPAEVPHTSILREFIGGSTFLY